jgi:hypothetical protein
LFDFMQSLSGAEFDFKFARPKKAYKKTYYKHVEFEMLERFRNAKGRYPLLNSNSGADQNIDCTEDIWWQGPLNGTGKRPRWALSALPSSGFKPLDKS